MGGGGCGVSVVQCHQLFVCFFFAGEVAAPPKMVQAPKRVAFFFSRVTEQLRCVSTSRFLLLGGGGVHVFGGRVLLKKNKMGGGGLFFWGGGA